MGNKTSCPQQKIPILFCQQFRNTAFPECMNALLVSELSIVVAAGMQWNMGIGNIMPDLRGEFENQSRIFFPKGLYQSLIHDLDPPGNNAMRPQTVFPITGCSCFPFPGK